MTEPPDWCRKVRNCEVRCDNCPESEMKYEDFVSHVEQNCCYETIYTDSEGRQILVIRLLDAYGMVNKAPQRGWQGLTDYDVDQIVKSASGKESAVYLTEAKIREKNK